jgi:hypothetical protein
MIDPKTMAAVLDSISHPIVFTDAGHVIRYLNATALEAYKDRGGAGLIGTSLLDCHKEEASRRKILEDFAALEAGEAERFVKDDREKGRRLFMRAVRDAGGKLIGYYERYEPLGR